ncbi:velvet factor-domain-containing protein [Mycena leptocephala]|nr:velvet factor-domain-containing protein [Mycena leptocephala]
MLAAPQQSGSQSHHSYAIGHQQPSVVGEWLQFTEGQFAGKTMRAGLTELQAATFGRKYAKKDRRPLDPMPVALLRLFELTSAETEIKINYDDIHILGLISTVELLVAPKSEFVDRSSPSPTTSSSYSPLAHSPKGLYTFGTPVSPHAMPPSSEYSSPGAVDYASPRASGSDLATTALAGTTFVQADGIPWNGKTWIMFVFLDLAVRTEGYFWLQYRFFDLFSRVEGFHENRPIQAECEGAVFKIYSSKEVPALPMSTELSKHLARHGVRINMRENQRKRKRKSRSPGASPPFTRKALARPDHSDDEDD